MPSYLFTSLLHFIHFCDKFFQWTIFSAPPFKNVHEMLPGIIQTFKNMGFTITAEGIENEDMADKMTALGCDYLQGYLFSKPLPIDEFIKYMEDHKD